MRKLCGSCPGRLKLASRCACARVSFEIGQRSMSGHRANGPVRVMSLAPRQRGGTGARRVVHKKSATFSRATGERWPSRLVATAEENRLNVRAATLLRGHVGDDAPVGFVRGSVVHQLLGHTFFWTISRRVTKVTGMSVPSLSQTNRGKYRENHLMLWQVKPAMERADEWSRLTGKTGRTDSSRDGSATNRNRSGAAVVLRRTTEAVGFIRKMTLSRPGHGWRVYCRVSRPPKTSGAR